MISLPARLVLGVTAVVLLSVIYWAIDAALVNSLRQPALVSGLVLFGALVLLTLFNVRKKIPFLPLLKASTWLQIHIYLGFFSMALFLFHIAFKLPHGWLEIVLAFLFLAVSFSGIIGLAISRWAPARLTVHGENLIFERIPAMRNALQQEVAKLAVDSVSLTRSTTIADFYEKRLHSYFERPRYIWSHLLGYSKPLHALLAEVGAMDRYLNAEERDVMSQIAECIRTKDNLDFQLAVQSLLKGWLFIHIPLTYALLLIALAHGLLAWRFS